MVDTFKEIVGIISSLVTLEEGGRSWIKEIAHLRDNKEFDLSKYRSDNENVERNIDHLIQYLESSNRIAPDSVKLTKVLHPFLSAIMPAGT